MGVHSVKMKVTHTAKQFNLSHTEISYSTHSEISYFFSKWLKISVDGLRYTTRVQLQKYPRPQTPPWEQPGDEGTVKNKVTTDITSYLLSCHFDITYMYKLYI